MSIESYKIDPNGDVLLILRNPRPPFAVWDENEDHPSAVPDLSSLKFVDETADEEMATTAKERKKKKKASRSYDVIKYEIPPPQPLEESIDDPLEVIDEPLAAFDEPPSLESPSPFHAPPVPSHIPTASNEPPALLDEAPEIVKCVKIRVSSRHLTLASPYYSDMFKGNYKEADTLRTNGSVEVEVEDINADALVVAMNIIHGRTRKVPRTVTLEMLAKIAVTVDLYQCHEVVELFTDMWITHLKKTLPKTYSRDAVLWICISWVFQQRNEFYSVTRATVSHSNGPIQSLGLPILPRLIGKSCSLAV